MKQRAYLLYAGYLLGSFILLTLGCGLGGTFGLFLPYGFLAFLSLVLILVFTFSQGLIKQVFFAVFCLGEGFLLTPILYDSGISVEVIFQALASTTLLTLLFLVIGFIIPNLSGFGGFLFYGLLGLLGLSLLNFVISIPFLTQFGIALFSLYIAYDINRFKRRVNFSSHPLSRDEIAQEAMSLFLDILNLFLKILSLLARSRD